MNARLRVLVVGLLLATLIGTTLMGKISTAYAASASSAVNYAYGHWTWHTYNYQPVTIDGNSVTDAAPNQGQGAFQCAEFVTRALAAGGVIRGIDPHTTTPSDVHSMKYNGVTMPLLSVKGLYDLLIQSGIGTDAGAVLSQARVGDVAFFGDVTKTPLEEAEQHVVLITKVGSTGIYVTGHNVAERDTRINSGYGIPLTHIVRVNYGTSVTLTSPTAPGVQLQSPAPYRGTYVWADALNPSGPTVSWEPITGAQGYTFEVYSITGGRSRTSTLLGWQSNSFTIPLWSEAWSYGVYNYTVGVLGDSSRSIKHDTFHYVPFSCLSNSSGTDCKVNTITGQGGSGVSLSSQPPPSTQPSPLDRCQNPAANQVALFTGVNYTGACVVKDPGDYNNPAAIGLPNDSISSFKAGTDAKVKLCAHDGLNSPCDELTGWDPTLGDNTVGLNTVSSVKVIYQQTSGCSPGETQVAFFEGTNYSGNCVTRGTGKYNNPSAMGIANDSVSSIRLGSNAKVQLCRNDNLDYSCEWFEGDDADLSNNTVGSDKASSAEIIIRGYVALCDRTNYDTCQYFSEGQKNLSDSGWSNRAESVLYMSGHEYLYHIVLYTGDNQTGTMYHADTNKPDIGDPYRNNIRSIHIYKNNPPPAPTNPSPENGSVLPSNTTSVTLSYTGSGNTTRVHVWSNDGTLDIWRDWNSATSFQLTNLSSGVYHWQTQGGNIVGEGPLSDVWTFYINRPPEVVVDNISITAGQTGQTIIGSWDPDGTATSLTSVSNLPSFATFTNNNNGTGVISVNPGTSDAGTYSVNVTASDGELTKNSSFIITVEPGQQPPVSGLFEDFEDGAADWYQLGPVDPAVDGTNDFFRFTPDDGSAEASREVTTALLAGYDTISVKINTHGATLLGNDASALYLNQGGWKYVALSSYIQQGQNGWQTVEIPLSAFTGFDKTASFSQLGFRFWMPGPSTIDIDDITFIQGTTPPPATCDLIDDFETGIDEWYQVGPVDPAADGSNDVMRFTPDDGSAEAAHDVGSAMLADYDSISVKINTHGATLLGNDASALYLNQGGWKYVALSDYIDQGVNGWQTVEVPLTDFVNFDKSASFSQLGFRFWMPGPSTIDIDDLQFCSQ